MINNRQNGRRRGRGPQVRNGAGGGNPDRGNRIDNRSRGNAAQLLEKYKNLARDAQTQGDRVMTEYYLQFADHYFRVLGESRQRFDEQNPNQQRRSANDFEYDDGDEADAPDNDRVAHGQYREDRGNREDRPQQRDDRPQREDRPERAQRDERGNRDDRPVREERAPRPPREQRPERRPETVSADETPSQPVAEAEPVGEGRIRRGRRPRRVEGEAGDEGTAPRIDVDRLPPAFAAEPEPAPKPRAVAPAETGEPEAVGEEAAPKRRRTRRAKPEEDGDSSVAA